MQSDSPRGSSQRGESFVEALSAYSRFHRAQHWSGTFGEFLRTVVPGNAPPAGAHQSRISVGHARLVRQEHARRNAPQRNGNGNGESAGPKELFKRELFGIDEPLGRVVDYFKAAAAGSDVGRRLLLLLGPPSGGKSTMAILLKRGLEEYSHTDEGAMYALAGLADARVAAQPHPRQPARGVPRHLRRRDPGRAEPVGARSPGARVRRRLPAHAGRARLPLGSLARRRRHLCAARSHDRRSCGPRRLRRPVQGRAVRRRRRSARLVVVGRGVCREPRRARDDRDPEGQARVPVPAADPDAGEERQGVALPADLPRRDDPRAHEPGGVPQVPAGEGERGAARPHGHRQGALHAVVHRRVAHLQQAGLRRAGVPRRAPRSARAAARRGVRGADAPAEARARGPRPVEEAAPVRGRERRRLPGERSRRACAPNRPRKA